ncbi:MAG: hypothetical protein HN350_21590 [Phycisphaerales bacterium]|jgi:hypothetical protein|nr:hypothetical protein [Phycisphaerales bacterium]
MDNQDQSDPVAQGSGRPLPNHGPMLYMGILLIVIIGLLAVLFTRERQRRVNAEQNVINLRQQNKMLRDAMRSIGTLGAATTQASDQN